MSTTSGSNVFLNCQALSQNSGNTTETLQCVSDQFQEDFAAKTKNIYDFLLVLSGAMIFFMQSGFAMLCAGSVRLKNVQNTMLKNLLDACGAALAFYFIGKWPLKEQRTKNKNQVLFSLDFQSTIFSCCSYMYLVDWLNVLTVCLLFQGTHWHLVAKRILPVRLL